MYQDGGNQPTPEQIIQAYAQLTGQDPQAIAQQLQGMGQEQVQQALSQMVAALQQGGQEQPMMQNGGKVLNERMVDGTFVPTPKMIKNPPKDTNGKILTQDELNALAHQKRGMGSLDFDSGYVQNYNPMINSVGNLTPDQIKQLKNYMDKSTPMETFYQALPNAGAIFGGGAAELPGNSSLRYQFQNGGGYNILPHMKTFDELFPNTNQNVTSQDTNLVINPNQIVSPTSFPQPTVGNEVMYNPSTQSGLPTYAPSNQEMINQGQEVIDDPVFGESTNEIDPARFSSPDNKIQFFNPYGGVDIPEAAGFLGSSIENKDALGIVGSGLKLATGLGRNIFGAMGQQRRMNQVMKDYYDRQRNDLTRTVVAEDGGMFFEEGGKVDLTKILTGEYITGMDKNNPIQEPNSEVEHREFLQHPDSEIQQVIGDTHEQGGEDVKLEEGTRILSDHLKVDKDLIKKFKDEYDVKLNASDTYARALEKYNKKIGLADLIEEQEGFIKELKKQQENTKDEKALGLNTQYLSEKLKEVEDKKKPLEEERKPVFNLLFGKQEDSKEGGKNEENLFEEGGVVEELASRYGLDKNKAMEIANYMQNGGYSNEDRAKRLNDFYNQIKGLGYDGEKEIGEMQKWMVKTHPDKVVDYFTDKGQPMTAKGIDIIKEKYADAFTKTGINPNKQSAQYTPDEKVALQTALGDKLDSGFWLEQFNDNKFDWRFPIVSVSGELKANSVDNGIVASAMPNPPSMTPTTDVTLNDENPDLVQTEEEKRNMAFLMLPDQYPLQPNSLQPHLKVNRRFDRLTPALISPEQNIVEANRSLAAANDQINNVPGAQRAAALIGLEANSQENINKVISETNKINSQIISSTDARNATIQASEENAGAQDALSYEQRQLRALGLTQNDVNNYFNKVQEVNTRNFNEVNNANLINANANHYQFDGQQFVQVDTPVFSVGNEATLTEEEKLLKAYEEAKAKKTITKKTNRFRS